MPPFRRSPFRGIVPLAFAVVTLVTTVAITAAPGFAAPPGVHAIVGARIVPAPGQVIERGTLVMRDGVITAVGARVTVPADARVWPGDSLTVYAGLIDAWVNAPEPAAPAGAQPAVAPRCAVHPLGTVRPEFRVAETFVMPADSLERWRTAGFAVAHFVPRRGIVRGSSAVVALSDAGAHRSVVLGDAAQILSLVFDPDGYPGSLMGAIAVIRQSLLDARGHQASWNLYRKHTGKPRPEANVSLEALEPVIAGRQPVFFLTGNVLEALRATALAREAGVEACVIGSGDEYKRVADLAKSAVPLVVPVRFPDAPDLDNPDDALEVTTEELRYWSEAPENPARLARAGVPFALTTYRLKDPKTFRAAVARAIAGGLDRATALAAVTTVPARLLGIENRAGTLTAGKAAHLTVVRGELFDESSKVVEVWVDGVRHATGGDGPTSPKGAWEITWQGHRARLVVAGERDSTVQLVEGGDTLVARSVRLEADRLRYEMPDGTSFDLVARGERLVGLVAGSSQPAVGVRVVERKAEEVAKQKAAYQPVPSPAVMGNTEAWRMTPPQARTVLIRNATLWTAGPQGTLRDADLLVSGGKIARVGRNLVAPRGALVIDGAGKHVAPGIIDAHSHSAIIGGVNECTNSVTAEVRVADVVNSESIQIYRQLAGGTTIMHLLHGSCNAIGGQSAVIKNKWGESPDRLVFTAAPPTIKFALGENPKRSNWGQIPEVPRYPQSRAGVEQVIRNAFLQARDYGAALAEWKRGAQPYPPRRDLQKDAILDILAGKLKIHAHAYRQDEILMLMRVAEEFGVRVRTFQHVLEGYKVADELAAHGATASAFSDWWAYKFETIDAIPYNGYLMWDRGVTVSFNSDSDDLARRLNTEAAKAVKYGGVPPEEAIQFVTLNPAKQLAIDGRVGSLETGKDADFSIWNGSPLSPYALCEQTWIEGRKYFDRAEDLAGREALARERDALIAKARSAKKGGVLASGERSPTWGYLEQDGHTLGCSEEEVGR